MKFLMKVGDELDLNVSYDGGVVDGVGYEVPAVCADIISVDAAGIVEALALGEGVVNVTNAGAVIGSIVFSVLSQAAYDAQQAIRGGDKELVVGAEEVSQSPVFTLITSGTAFASATAEGSPANAFDGLDGTLGYPPATLWGSADTFTNAVNAYIGKNFDSPKMVKKIRVQWVTAPTEVDVIVHSGNVNIAPLVTINPVYQDFNGAETVQWQEFILPAYTPVTGIVLKPKVVTAVSGSYWQTNGGIIDRFRVWEIQFYE